MPEVWYPPGGCAAGAPNACPRPIALTSSLGAMPLVNTMCIYSVNLKGAYPFEDQLQYVMINVSTAWIGLQNYNKVFESSLGGQLKTIVLN